MMRVARGARRVLGALAIATAVIALLALSSRVVMPKNNQTEFGQINAAANGVMGEPADTIDVLFLGDSEAFSSFSPLQLWGEQGITSYVCATSAQRLYYTTSLLARALENQSPRVVVLETNCIFSPMSVGDAAMRALSDLFPVFEYHNRWKSLTVDDFVGPVRATWTDDLKGFRLDHATQVKPADATTYMQETDDVQRLSRFNWLYLQEIKRMCDAAGARLVLVSTPSTANWNMARHRGMAQAASELMVDYYDLNVGDTKVEIDWSSETYDAGDHLNLSGAQKVTSAVGKILRGSYDIADHRQDTAYDGWNDAYARYRQRLSQLGGQLGTGSF